MGQIRLPIWIMGALVLIAADSVAQSYRDCPLCPQMVVIKPGEVTIDDAAAPGGKRRIAVKYDFAIGKYEVTQAEYRRVFPDRASFFSWPDGPGAGQVEGMDTSRFPAELVKWVDATEGALRVEALDASGELKATSTDLTGDEPRLEVQWKEETWSDFTNSNVRLRFTLRNARLYSYWLKS